MNGDGIDDVLIGAANASPGGREAAGQGYVVFGTAAGFPAEIELSALLEANGGDGSVGFALNGIDIADHADTVSAAGDVNADGIGDVLIGASGADPGGRDGAGETYVVFGQTPGSFAAEFELSELLADNGGDGSAGFVLNGTSEDNYTYRVGNAGDINADGADDIFILSNDESYVVFGCAGYPETAPVPALLYPADGATDVSPLQKLYWEQTSPAWGHTIELATDPGFMEVVYRARSRSDSGHLFPLLAGATQYYWRVIANDACRFAVSDVRTFTTAEKPCQSHAATDLPLVTIPRSTVTSSVVVPETPPLIDVNLLDVNGVHSYMGHLTFILKSPAGTEQWLYRRTCAGNDGFAFSLDDEATTPIPCPPIDGGTHQPENPLIVYRDEIPTGTWELSIEDIGVLGTGAGGGTLLEWNLETCWTPAEPVIFDSDGDGIEEDADNCVGVANPGQCNSDGDRFGNHCDADFDNNGIVNSFDLSILRANFGVSQPAPYNVADLDCNGIVNSFDLSILRGRFGTAPGPSGLP